MTTKAPKLYSKVRMFGTDGIRGPVGGQWVNPSCFYQLGLAISQSPSLFVSKRTALIGRDPRESSQALCEALIRGLNEGGVDVVDLGVVPTPVVSHCTERHEASIGLMVTASHNPYTDNGLKIFASDGGKLHADQQDEVSAFFAKVRKDKSIPVASTGRHEPSDLMASYIKACVSQFKDRLADFSGCIVCDCANGATSALVPKVFEGLGLAYQIIHAKPSGTNINEACGSTSLESLREAVIASDADLGVAFDGDGDRVLMVDHDGELIDGDDMLLAMVRYARSQGEAVEGVVGTVMSNEALVQLLQQEGVVFERAPVGDRHVVGALKAHGWRLGSEPSGHVVNLAYANTGDGLMSMLQWLAWMQASELSAAALRKQLQKFPQVLINVPVEVGYDYHSHDLQVKQALIQEALGHEGRLLLRASGTEPLVRVMVEGAAHLPLQDFAEQLAGCIRKENTV